MLQKLYRFLRSEDGPTAVEYAVMLAMIVMVCIGAISLLGQSTAGSFTNAQSQITAAMSGS